MSDILFTPSEMSPVRVPQPMSAAAAAALTRMAVEAGQRVRSERRRRRWTMRKLADLAGVALGVVHRVESGQVGSLETYARLAIALGLPPELLLDDARAHTAAKAGGEDIVHAAMGEWEARMLAGQGRHVAIDEPYQDYQFAGRADVLVVNHDERNLLHIENRTQFPNLQDAAVSWNAGRQYLATEMAERRRAHPRHDQHADPA
jgi:transcriptional regulator with XRE-family HTH domain